MTDTAVEKTLAVLEALADHSRITDIARVTGLPKSTVHRLLQAMVDHGFAAVRSDGGYLAGPKVLVMAGKILRPVDTVERARPALRALREQSSCTVHLAMVVGDELVYVDKVEADKPYRMPSRLGMSLSIHSSAIGKAVLGSMAAGELDALITRLTLTGRTPNTITGEDRLRAELAEVRRTGCGFDDEENEVGIRCVGAAVRDHTGAVVGGLSASTLAMEHTMEQLTALGPRVLEAAQAVSTALGYVE
ncbi:IclR family transcriptional regulator [Umezawaea tangerina]|uniref:IclR family transcriptional regulator n=1 Tax=Umezawaea tangerina TaxID=84725 RepID=A0A2T0TKR6_9PSEU|nr:IclR family transcriptional regulator [Umezawaea tangerina]PRY46225.1 IclR family transcriptional regulator [Umezawaea tangerina]